VGDSLLETGGQVGAALAWRRWRAMRDSLAMDRIQYRRLEPAETEIKALLLQKRSRKGESRWVALLGVALKRGAPRKAQPENTGHFVERFAGGVVHRRAQELKGQGRPAVEQAGVPAADDQADAR